MELGETSLLLMKKHLFFLLSAMLVSVALLSSCGGHSSSTELTPDPGYLYPMGSVSSDDMVFVDIRTGEELPGQFAAAHMFFDGLALVQDKATKLYGYVDPTGQYVIKPQYVSATAFAKGVAIAALPDSGLACIDHNGDEVFRLPEVEWMTMFFRESAAVGQKTTGEVCIIDRKGNISVTLDEGQALVSISYKNGVGLKDRSGKCGVIDWDGKLLIPYQYDGITLTEGDCAIYQSGGKYGLVSLENEILTGADFDEITEFDEDRLQFKQNGKRGIMDMEGKQLVPAQFDRFVVDGDWYVVKQGKLYGWCDAKGEVVINPQFDEVQLFGDASLAAVRTGKSWGYIDKKGKFAINPQFSAAGYFCDGLAPAARSEDLKMGYIDEDGKFVIEPQFDAASSFGDGIALVSKDRKIGFIDEDGTYVINPQFSDARSTKELRLWLDDQSDIRRRYIPWGRAPFFSKDHLLPVITADSKMVLIDKTGHYVSKIYKGMSEAGLNWYSASVGQVPGEAHSDKVDVQQLVEQFVSTIREIVPGQTAKQLKAHYNLSESDFNNQMVTLTEKQFICSRVSVKARCNPWNRVYDGWFGYKRVFNENCVPEYYEVAFSLTNKAANKGEKLRTAFRKAFSKELNYGEQGGHVNDMHVSLISEDGNTFLFRIKKGGHEI